MPIQPELHRAAEPFTDEEIVQRVRRGDTPMFEALMRRNNRRLYRAVRAVLRDEAEVEEVMQQTYVSAFTHLDQFAAEAKFGTWLLRIGINEALGRLRQRRRELQPLIEHENENDNDRGQLPMDSPTPEDRAANRELASFLERTIDELPPSYREVFVLRLVEGLDTAETAQVLEIGQEAVKQRLHRARGMVQRLLEEQVGVSAGGAFEFLESRCDRVVGGVLARLRVA